MLRALILTLALTACASGPREELPPPQLPQRAGVDPIVAARAEGVAFRAVGEGFALSIYRAERIVLSWGDHEFEFPKPEPLLPRWNGEIYETSNGRYAMTVEIRRLACEAGGETWPARVAIVIDGERLEGCGRDL